MKNFLYVFSIILFSINAASQNLVPRKPRFYFSGGYGLAGSFFVRSYNENPFPNSGYKALYKKNFIGSNQNIGVGIRLNNNGVFKEALIFSILLVLLHPQILCQVF